MRNFVLGLIAFATLGATCLEPNAGLVDPTTCPPPTGEQCAHPTTPCDQYFVEQARLHVGLSTSQRTPETAACSLLMVQGALSEASRYPTRTVLKPTTYTSIKRFPPDASVTEAHTIVPPESELTVSGLGSAPLLRSQLTTMAARRSKSVAVQFDAHTNTLLRAQQYEANGDEVASCREYVAEKFYDLTTWEDQVQLASGAHDVFRAAYDLAYAPGGANAPRWAIGSRHLVDQTLRGRDGTPVSVALPFEATLPKNDFFRVRPSTVGAVSFSASSGEDGISTIPFTNNVKISLKYLKRKAMTLEGVAFDDATLEPALAQGRAYYVESFDWHRKMGARNATVLDEQLAELQGRRAIFLELLHERDELVQRLVELLGGGTGPPVAGASRFETKWWLDPLWNPNPDSVGRIARVGTDVLNGLNVHPGGATQIVQYSQSVATSQSDAEPSRVWGLGAVAQWVSACGTNSNPVICASYRLAAIDAAIEAELIDARAQGCLDFQDPNQPAPCDWSPRDFMQRMAEVGDAERLAAFEKCDETVDDFALAKARAFQLDAPDGGAGVNYPAEDYTQSPSRLEVYFERLDEYLEVLAGTVGPLMSRQPVNGSYKLRLARYEGDDHQMGNEWFGAHLNYSAGFAMEEVGPTDECEIKTRVDGDFVAGADVLTEKVELVKVSLHANQDRFISSGRVFGETWEFDEPVPMQQVAVFTDGDVSYTEFGHAEGYITIGYVVISIGAGAGGGVGYAFQVNAGKQTVQGNPCKVSRLGVTPSVLPFVYVEAQAWAALEAVVARAGVKGYLTLARVSIPVEGELSLGPNKDAVTVIDANFRLGAELRLNFFSGRIVVFVEVGICPLCASFEADLVSWPGITHRVPLFDYELGVVLGDLRRVATQQGVIPAGAP